MRYMIICLASGPTCTVPNELHDHIIGPEGISEVVLEHLGGHSGLGFCDLGKPTALERLSGAKWDIIRNESRVLPMKQIIKYPNHQSSKSNKQTTVSINGSTNANYVENT